MAKNLFIQLIARLNKSLSKTQIQSDLNDIEKTPFYIRVIARLNKSLTRRNIENSVQDAARNISVDVNARVSERELQQSYETARQNLENRIQNDPIEIPVNVDTEGIQQGQHQIHNLNNEARNARNIFTEYLNAREIFRAIANAIKMAVNEVKELNKAQTDLQMVTEKSNSEMTSLMGKYNNLAKDLSVTTKNITSSADEWLRQGKSVAETDELIKDSVILAKVGQIEAADATKYLTSAMNGFKTETSDVIGIVDKLTNVDLESATSAGGLAEAMSKCANSAEVAGVSMDSLIGYIATVAEVTQKSDSVVGESFKSILARMGKIKLNNWIDEDGKDISGEINDVEKTLAQFDIKLRNSATEFRNFEDVIYDVGMAWDKFSSVDQNAIANAFGGVYQRENVITLFENFSRALELSEVSANSAGTAYKKFEVYENSLEAATNRLTASFESLAYNTIDASFISNLANATASIVEFVDSTQLIKTGLTAGIFTGAIVGLTVLGTRMIVVRNNITQFTQAMNLSRQTTALTAVQHEALRNAVNGLTEAQLRLVLSSRQLTEAQRLRLMQSAGIEQARQRQLLQTWNLTNATNAETVATFSLRGAWEGLKASIASNPMGLVITALTLATTAISNYNQKQKELAEQIKENTDKAKEYSETIDNLIDKYSEFANKTSYTTEEKETLLDIQNQLVSIFGQEASAIDLVNSKYEEQIKTIQNLNKEKLEQNKSTFIANRDNAKYDKSYNTLGFKEFTFNSDVLDDSFDTIFEEVAKKSKDAGIYNAFGKHDSLYAGNLLGFDSFINLTGDAENRLKQLRIVISTMEQYQKTDNTLYKDLVAYESELQTISDNYFDATSNLAENLFDLYKIDNSVSDVGKETYTEWKEGLLAQAEGDSDLQDALLNLIEDQFPDYAKYFENLDKAKSKFTAYEGTNKYNFIKNLSDEDLDILVNKLDIEDPFKDGLEGASKLIQEFKSDPNNEIGISFDYSSYSEQVDDVVKNVDKVQSALDKLNSGKGIDNKDITELANAFPDYSSKILSAADNTEKLKSVLGEIKSNAPSGLINTLRNLKDLSADDQDAVNGLIAILSNLNSTASKYADTLADLETKEGLLSTAYKEMHDDGQISLSTYQKLIDSGIDYSEAIENVNGKITVNSEKLKELTKAKYVDEIATLELTKAEIGRNVASDPKYYMEQINAINDDIKAKKEALDLLDAYDYTTTANKGKTEKPQSVLDFEKELAEKEHEIAMGQREENEDYYSWLLSAAHTAYDGLADYQDDLWKYEEEVYKGRKQLADNFYDEQQKDFEDRISSLEDDIDKAMDGKLTSLVSQSDIDDLNELNQTMQELYQLGNVDLTKRPKVNAETMRKAGYEAEDGETATVYSSFDFLWQGDEEHGKYVAVHYTPILPDGTVLDEKTLNDYLDTLVGSDDILKADTKGIILKVDSDVDVSDADVKSLETDKPTENIQSIIKACEDWDIALHNIQAEWMVLDEAVNNASEMHIEDKFEYIRSAYQEIINEIDGRINEIVQGGIEGHEDDLKKLEEQRVKYSDKLAELPKTAAEEEQTYIKKLKDDYSNLYDERIKKLKKQKEATEKAFKAEIDAIQKKIDALKDANDKEQEALEIEKARQELEKANQSTRQVYGSDGSISFKVDDEKVKEAQENLDKVMQEKQINILEKQKQALEDVKTKESEAYDSIIDNLETEKENSEKRFDILLDALDKYLNPDQGESNSDVWKMLAHLEGATYKNGVWTDKDGKAIDIDKLLETSGTAKKEDNLGVGKKPDDTRDALKGSLRKDNNKDDVIRGHLTRQNIGNETSDVKDVADTTGSVIESFFSNLEKKLGLKDGSLSLDKVSDVLNGSNKMGYNPYANMTERVGTVGSEYANANNVNNNNVTNITIGDININNPVGNSDDLAKELRANLHNAADKIIYSNLRR